MTRKQLLTIQEPLLAEFPQFIARGDLMYLATGNGLLRAIHFDGSGFNKSWFYVTSLLMPLCVPKEHLVLSYGTRLRIDEKFDNWEEDTPYLETKLKEAIAKQAVPLFESVRDLPAFVAMSSRDLNNVRYLEDLGYALTRLGRARDAIAIFDDLLKQKRTAVWEHALAERASSLVHLLETDPKQAMELTTAIEAETRLKLKLASNKETA